ncbi:MAG TPA: 30S ribosomal protein S6 [Solirubrobacteraceae bacterium]|jgi:small subunit ribosomal protein S6
MTLPAPTYDLVLLLDTQAEEQARAKIVTDTREAIAAKGELTRHDEWGERPLAYPIDHKTSAEYHLLQFHATEVELIAELNRTLHITDGVVRFRINKLKPGTPEAPEMRPERVGAMAAREEVPAHAREETIESAPPEEHPEGHIQGAQGEQAVA